MNVDSMMRSVQEFHLQKQLCAGQKFATKKAEGLISAGARVVDIASRIPAGHSDQRNCRAHLILEEAGELVKAMGMGDEAESLDGVADLTYVVVGTCCVFDWPLGAAFAEAHASNMTKTVTQRRDGHPGKDEATFTQPDFSRVLATHREARKTPGFRMWDAEPPKVRTQQLRSKIERLCEDLTATDRTMLERFAGAMSWSAGLNKAALAAMRVVVDQYEEELQACQDHEQ